jgi:hypothetical protein
MELKCRLCADPSDLCRSHILPEFLYRPLYDDKHRFSVVTKGTHGIQYKQRGLTERLLCRKCEQFFGRNERYASEVMTGRLGHSFEKRVRYIEIDGIDYQRFKLFQLSILWRASVSSLEFFRLVSLGSREATLRQMLLQNDPGAPEQFGCVVIFARDGGEDISDTLFNPEPVRWGGRRMYKFFFAGSAWLFHCDKQPAALHLRKFFLQRDGRLLGYTGDLVESLFHDAAATRFARKSGYA